MRNIFFILVDCDLYALTAAIVGEISFVANLLI